MKKEKIDIVKKWPEPKSVWDIQIFFTNFINFYQRFIKGFNRIIAPLIAILKRTRSSVASAFRVNDNELVGDRGAVGRSDMLKKLTYSKSWTKSGNSNNSEESKFLTSKAKEILNRLRQVFTKAPILWHFNSECYIQIETNASDYAIGGVLSQ